MLFSSAVLFDYYGIPHRRFLAHIRIIRNRNSIFLFCSSSSIPYILLFCLFCILALLERHIYFSILPLFLYALYTSILTILHISAIRKALLFFYFPPLPLYTSILTILHISAIRKALLFFYFPPLPLYTSILTILHISAIRKVLLYFYFAPLPLWTIVLFWLFCILAILEKGCYFTISVFSKIGIIDKIVIIALLSAL